MASVAVVWIGYTVSRSALRGRTRRRLEDDTETGPPGPALWRRAAGAGLGAAALVAIVADQAGPALDFRAHEELPGSARFLEEMDAIIEPEALVVFEPRTRRGLLRFEAATDFILDRRVLRWPVPSHDDVSLQRLVWLQESRGHPTYLLTTGYLEGLEVPYAEPVHEFRFTTVRMRELYHAVPDATEQMSILARLYRLHPGGSRRALEGGLDVGPWDEMYLEGQWFHEAETDAEGRTYRWTSEIGRFLLDGFPDSVGAVAVTADSDYPAELGTQVVEAYLDGLPLGEVEVRDGWIEYRWPVPAAWSGGRAGVAELELRTEAFRPYRHGLGDDRRLLGIKVDGVRWESRAPS
jgi:hypothetical protein